MASNPARFVKLDEDGASSTPVRQASPKAGSVRIRRLDGDGTDSYTSDAALVKEESKWGKVFQPPTQAELQQEASMSQGNSTSSSAAVSPMVPHSDSTVVNVEDSTPGSPSPGDSSSRDEGKEHGMTTPHKLLSCMGKF